MKLGISSLLGLVSIAIAFAFLAASSWSIGKNQPTQVEKEPRFNPPSAPGPETMGPSESSSEPLPNSTSADRRGFIGGVGLVEPKSELIEIGSMVSGVVSVVAVKAGDLVKKDQLLFTVDNRRATASVERLKAAIGVASARADELRAEVLPAKARVESASAFVRQAQSNVDYRREQLRRAESLVKTDAITQEELDNRKSDFLAASAVFDETTAKLREAEASLSLLGELGEGPTVKVQERLVDQARAELAEAQTQLDQHSVLAPRDATVLQVRIHEGEFAFAGPLTESLIILGDLTTLHVRCEVDEAEAYRVRPESRAWATPRGQTDVRIPLRFVRFEPLVIPKRVLAGTTSERVDTRIMQVIYAVDDAASNLRVGQQADVFIEDPQNR